MARAPRPLIVSALSKHSASLRTCVFCQYRLIATNRTRSQSSSAVSSRSSNTSSATSTTPSRPSQPAAPQPSPSQIVTPQRPKRPHVRAYDGELVPQPLNRPLGLAHPPQPGQNSGKDTRSWKQKREDFASYDKHLERRQDLIKNLYEKNYFRDIGNLGRIHKGKSILAPTTPFRAHLARYFPNLQGRTLLPSSPAAADTTPVLRGKVSVVSVLNTEWAKGQCQTFVDEKVNPTLHEVVKESKGVAQMVEINVEENWVKHFLIRICLPFVRRKIAKQDWGRYFLVGRGLDDEIREALGIWNGKVGYVYLLDPQCKVRWAGNGDAREDERASLVNCVRRLVDEANGARSSAPSRIVRQDARPTGRLADLHAPSISSEPARRTAAA